MAQKILVIIIKTVCEYDLIQFSNNIATKTGVTQIKRL